MFIILFDVLPTADAKWRPLGKVGW